MKNVNSTLNNVDKSDFSESSFLFLKQDMEVYVHPMTSENMWEELAQINRFLFIRLWFAVKFS